MWALCKSCWPDTEQSEGPDQLPFLYRLLYCCPPRSNLKPKKLLVPGYKRRDDGKNKGFFCHSETCALCAHPAVVAELIAILFAFMGADEELQVVSSENLLRDIWAPVAASPSHFIGNAAILGHRITPQQVYHLDRGYRWTVWALWRIGLCLTILTTTYLFPLVLVGLCSFFTLWVWVRVWLLPFSIRLVKPSQPTSFLQLVIHGPVHVLMAGVEVMQWTSWEALRWGWAVVSQRSQPTSKVHWNAGVSVPSVCCLAVAAVHG